MCIQISVFNKDVLVGVCYNVLHKLLFLFRMCWWVYVTMLYTKLLFLFRMCWWAYVTMLYTNCCFCLGCAGGPKLHVVHKFAVFV